MKTNKKKRLTVSLLAVITILALVLTGCGTKNTPEHNEDIKDDVTQETTESTETSEPAGTEDTSQNDETSPTEEETDPSKETSEPADEDDDKDTGNGGSGGTGGNPTKPTNPPTEPTNPSTEPPTKPTNPPTEPTNPPTEPSEPVHTHSYTTVISSSAGDCCHDGSVTKQCSCGETKTESTGRGSHNWVTDYKIVHHDAEYKDVYHEAVYEYRPIYEWVGWYECKKCGAKFDNTTDATRHGLTVDGGTYTYKEEQQPTGEYEKVLVKDAWTEKVLVKEAWDEQVVTGQHCTICGKKK